MSDIRQGNLVRKGAGKKIWRVAGFWWTGSPSSGGFQAMASLEPTDGGYTTASAPLDQLTVLERAS